jgi:Peptidase family M28
MILIYIILPLLSLNSSQINSPDSLETRLKNHVYFLASNDLHGRESGTEYEKMATSYIENEFKDIGLEPMGENGTFFQDFEFLAGKTLGENNFLIIDDVELTIEKDFIPLSFSAEGRIEGKILVAGLDNDEKEPKLLFRKTTEVLNNKVFIIKISEPDSINRNWTYHKLSKVAIRAEKKGASAAIFYSNDPTLLDVKANYRGKIPALDIPVILATNYTLNLTDSTKKVQLKVEHIEDRKIGRNVIGMIDNGSKNTIIIAGHHDGLGHGENSNFFSEADTHLIHNGADDGASGLSVLIEYARHVKNQRISNNNYLFISFSGEEIGILGSMYFTHNPTIDLNKVNYMMSLDHIGRMDHLEESFILYGTGTSPGWSDLIREMKAEGDSMITFETGIGLTDYTSFYLKKIPVLGICTDTHEDFHMPTDDAHRINYEGMVKIFDFVTRMESSLASTEKLEFTNTTDPHELLKYLLRHTNFSLDGIRNQ